MPAWRREFLARFPQFQREVQDARDPSELIHRPLFFVLKDAIDQGEQETIEKVVSFVIWLSAEKAGECEVQLEEDLFSPIMQSERLRAGFLQMIDGEEFEQLKKYWVEGWRPESEKEAKRRSIRIEYDQIRRKRQGGAGAV